MAWDIYIYIYIYFYPCPVFRTQLLKNNDQSWLILLTNKQLYAFIIILSSITNELLTTLLCSFLFYQRVLTCRSLSVLLMKKKIGMKLKFLTFLEVLLPLRYVPSSAMAWLLPSMHTTWFLLDVQLSTLECMRLLRKGTSSTRLMFSLALAFYSVGRTRSLFFRHASVFHPWLKT